MKTYSLPQNDKNLKRSLELLGRRTLYDYDRTTGIPLRRIPGPIRDINGPEWLRQTLDIAVRLRFNMEAYIEKTPFKFTNPYPPDLTSVDFLKFVLTSVTLENSSLIKNLIDSGANIFETVLPDLGHGGSVSSIQQYKDLFISLPIPEIASRYDTDETFAHTLVAGANPGQLQRLKQVSANFPIRNEHFRKVKAFGGDNLDKAIAEGRVYYIDHSDLVALENGKDYGVRTKYVYAPFVALAVPRGGTRLLPFAIQCGPTPEGRQIYTPEDGYSWKIAKNCVLVAHNVHHELATHLALTHYLLDGFVMATRRHLASAHPIYNLLNQHFEGTLLINYLATNNLVQPGRAVDRLMAPDLNSAYKYVGTQRLNYSFKDNYFPARFARRGTNEPTLLGEYPYRDDGLLIWSAIHSWMSDFVHIFYPTESDIVGDMELQAWAEEIASADGAQIKDFGNTPGKITSYDDLIDILTMIIFTAGPQHAAVNFSQLTDMSFTPANPFAGSTPEPKGTGHTEQDWLNHLPPIETAITAINILHILGGVKYTKLGHYYDDPQSRITDFESGPINEAVKKFRSNLAKIELEITERNKTRYAAYVHLLPSRIPQSTNI